MAELLPECPLHQVIWDARRRTAATMAKKLAEDDSIFPRFTINLHWSIYTPAAPTTQMPLHMEFTDDINKRLQSADLLWQHTYCRWHEPRSRFTQRTWWLKYNKGLLFPSEEVIPPPVYPRPSCPLMAKGEHTRACIAAYHVQLPPLLRAIKETS